MEVAGFLTADDSRVLAVQEALGIDVNRTMVVGAYATPLGATALRQTRDTTASPRKAG